MRGKNKEKSTAGVFGFLDEAFAGQNTWGSRSFLAARLRDRFGLTWKRSREVQTEWARNKQKENEADQDPRERALWDAHDREGRRLFTKRRWEAANFGWVCDADWMASKVYGKEPKVLESWYEGDTIKHLVKDY